MGPKQTFMKLMCQDIYSSEEKIDIKLKYDRGGGGGVLKEMKTFSNSLEKWLSERDTRTNSRTS